MIKFLKEHGAMMCWFIVVTMIITCCLFSIRSCSIKISEDRSEDAALEEKCIERVKELNIQPLQMQEVLDLCIKTEGKLP
jgi:hypothetical protein